MKRINEALILSSHLAFCKRLGLWKEYKVTLKKLKKLIIK